MEEEMLERLYAERLFKNGKNIVTLFGIENTDNTNSRFKCDNLEELANEIMRDALKCPFCVSAYGNFKGAKTQFDRDGSVSLKTGLYGPELAKLSIIYSQKFGQEETSNSKFKVIASTNIRAH